MNLFLNFTHDTMKTATFFSKKSFASIKKIFVITVLFVLSTNISVRGQACDYFTAANSTNVTGWTEQVGDWSINNNTLLSPATTVWNYITFNGSTQTNGCVTARATYGSTTETKYVGVVGRYNSSTSYLMAKIQDNGTVGYWDSYFIYENDVIISSVTSGLNFGTDANIQLEYNGTSVTMRIDTDLNGTWDYTYTATSTTTNSGLCGVGSYAQCTIDNWCYGTSCLTCAPPANETCAAATVISGSATPYSTSGVLGCSDDCSGTGYFDVFYSFTPTYTGTYTADMGLSAGDTYMRIFSGSCCGTLVASDDDSYGDMDPTITLTLTGGTTYYFELGSYSSSGMGNSPYNFNLIRNCTAPANETCAGATEITYAQIAAAYNTAGTLGCTDDCSGQGYNDLFYLYNCTCTGSYTFDMRNSDGDTYMRIFSGSCCGTLVASDDDSYGGLDPTITVTLTSGTSYWIECGTYSSSDYVKGTAFNLYASTTCSMLAIGCGNTDLGIISPSTCTTSTAAYSAGTIPYWSFTATAGYTYHFTLGSNSEDSYLHLYDASYTELASNDDNGPLFSGVPASLSWTCTTSGTYYITACHYTCTAFTNSGSMSYWSTMAPYGVNSGTTITPTSAWQNQAYTAGNLYWYYFYGNAGTAYDFSLCDNTEDTYLKIFDLYWNQVAYNDDNGPFCSGVPASLEWTPATSGTYIVAVYHYGCNPFTNSANLAYRILSCTPPAAPASVTATPSTICGGGTSMLNATSTGNTINWWNAATGGTFMGSSASGVDFSVTATGTTTYYAEAQSGGGGGPTTITTTFGAGNNFNGNMFDVNVLQDITVNSFDVNSEAATLNYEVYYKTGTWVGFEATPAAWTLIGTATGIVGNGSGIATPLNLSLNLNLTAGQTYAFYITNTSGTMYYTDGTAVGNIYTSNADIEIEEGWGGGYPFGAPNTPRIWNGTIHYNGGSPCVSTTRTPVTVTVCPTPDAPTSVTATPLSICTGGSSQLNATSAGNTIYWWDAATGGTLIGTSSSGLNFTVNPTATTTYYAEAQSTCSGGGGGSGVAAMPAESSTFSSNVRGYFFTAPSSFTITGLNCLAPGTTQNLAVVRFNGAVPPPVYSSFTNDFTTLFLTQGNTNTGVIPCSISVAAGDVIGILGSRGTGDDNSYGPSPSTTTINGTSVTIARLGMQYPLATTAPTELWTEDGVGISRVEFTYGDAGGSITCTSATRTPVTVTLSDNITPSFTGMGPYCEGETPGTLPATSINSITGTWSPATINTASAGTTTYTFTPDGGQCATVVTMDVTVNTGNIIPTFTALGPYCAGDTPGTLSGTSTNGITGSWSPATISTASAGTVTYTFTPVAGQCALTTAMDITTNPLVTPAFTTLGPYCAGDTPGTLSGTSTNGITGSWSPATISTASAGTATHTFTPTAGQCANTTTMNITVNATVTPTFTALGPYCVGIVPGTLPGTSNNGITGSWSPATISTAFAGTTTYTFTPTAGQCAVTTTMDISVISTIMATLGEDTLHICDKTSPGTFTATVSGGEGTYTYQWYTFTTGLVSGATTSTYNPGIMTTSNAFYCQVSSSLCGSTNSDTVIVYVIPQVGNPTPITIAGGTEPLCQLPNGTTTTTYATTATNNIGFHWSINNPLAGSIDSVTGVITWANGFYGSVNIQVYALGCGLPSPTITHTVTVYKTPVAEAGPWGSYTGSPIQIGDTSSGPGAYSWLPVAGLNDPNIEQPLASPLSTTTYTLTVDNNGCVATDTVTIVFGGLGHTISGKTVYAGKANAGSPAPNLPTYNPVIYAIDKVIVILKNFPANDEVARDTSDTQGLYQFSNVPDGNYILSYDKYISDTMIWGNDVTAIDIALLKYFVGSDTATDPTRCFSAKYKRAANVDNNTTVNAIDISRIKAKVGSPFDVVKNFPKGNWVAFDKNITVAGSDLSLNLETICYGDYNASSSKYRDSVNTWSGAKSLPGEFVVSSDEIVMINNPSYFEVPLKISTKVNDFSALGLEMQYPYTEYELVTAHMATGGSKNSAVKINPSLEEVIANDNDLLVTDDHGTIRVVYATTNHFDVAPNDEMIVFGFRPLKILQQGEIEFPLSATGVIGNQYGQENDDAYLLIPKIFVQGNNTDTEFELAGFPNPFNDEATITYTIPENGTVKLNVYNAIGELVSVLVNETQVSGKHSFAFSQINLPAGMYTFRFEFTGSDMSKCLILKMIH